MHTVKIKLTFIEEVLGTSSANPDLVREYIASKRPAGLDDEEIKALPTVDEELQKGMTVFAKDDSGRPILWDYQIKGFFKDACGVLQRVTNSAPEESGPGEKKPKKKKAPNESGRLTAYKKIIDGLVFVEPRMIPITIPSGKKSGICERPLRAQTAQGERVALARSQTAPAGSVIEFTVRLLDAELDGALEEWLDYGRLRGIGQWRNSGKGRFTFERS